MVKTRMGLLDLRVQTTSLHDALRGSRVTNVYDAQNGRTYILKLSVPPYRTHHPSQSSSTSASHQSLKADTHSQTESDSSTQPAARSSPQPLAGSSSWEKRLLLLESGVRLHMTEFDREKDVPSGFCLKLRKHIRTRRLDAIRQLGDGGDRILDLVFSGEGKICAHLIVEAFSGGNVILTDGDYNILTLLRTYRISAHDTGARVAIRERYPIEKARLPTKIDRDAFREAATKALADVPDEAAIAAATGKGMRKKLLTKGIARRALASSLALEPSLLEHSLVEAGFDADVKLHDFCHGDGVDRVYEKLHELENNIAGLLKKGAMKGYIVSAVQKGDGDTEPPYDEFSPYFFSQYRGRVSKEFETFDQAADEFFSTLEAKRAEAAQGKREAAAFKKVDKLASELHGQVAVLESAKDLSWERAQAIEANIVEVDAAITVIRSAIAASVPWDGLAKMVEDEKKNGNPVAEIIHSLQLGRNEITLMLEDTYGDDAEEEAYGGNEDREEDENSEEENFDGSTDERDQSKREGRFQSSAGTRKVLLITVDLDLRAHANARRHYEQRKSAAAKMEKAVEATGRTLKAATKRAETEARRLEADAAAASIRARRKALWFEKFYWFVSSENYLVVAGRDAQQNELLVKRYLGPSDVYVHADLTGASSVIVKNRKLAGSSAHTEIPQMTLEQAGTFAMCRSAAWDSKIVTSAWWVRASQISKSATTGDYLPVGSFAIRGKKNFLNPTQLIMGVAFLFKIDEACVENHRGERNVRGLQFLTAAVDEKLSVEEPSMTPPVADREVDLSPIPPPIETEVPADETENIAGKSAAKAFVVDDEDIPPRPATTEKTGDAREASAHAAVSQIESNESKEILTARSKKRHLSAKERKALRNARNGKSVDSKKESEDKEEEPMSVAEQQDEAKGSSSGGGDTTNHGPVPRRRKHKLKKLKKYQDQDEEERRIALAVLGSRPVKGVITGVQSSTGKEPTEDTKNGQDADSKENGRDRKAKREERQEAMRLSEEEGIIELNRLEHETVGILDTLTAAPITEDEVQFALPVCAPYSALANYRYKAKLMPGSMKRGKAYRAAVVLFLKQAERDLEKFKADRDAMRISPESDGIHGMLGSVRIMAPGLADAQKSLQKSKKNAAAKKQKQR